VPPIPPTRRRRAVVATLTGIATLLTGCASVVSGSPTLASVPNARLPVHGSSGNAFDTEVTNAISDVIGFWQVQYPKIANGAALPKLTGGLWSVDGAQVIATEHAPAAVKGEACIAKQPTFVIDNAAYCPNDDSIIWDRSADHLLPVLARNYGPALVAMVFAHEFGHAIQHRLGILNQQLPTIDTESQADCASGAFLAGALEGQAPHFHLTDSQVDRALEGYLQIRDSTPESPADISHGNGFDRLSAVENGIEHGVTYCYSSTYFSTRSFTERPFAKDSDDAADNGNESLAQVLDANDPTKDKNAGGLQPSLNQFWTKAATTIGKKFHAVTIAESAHPKCGSADEGSSGNVDSEFGYCPDDNTVYYSHSFAARAYDSLTTLQIEHGTADVSLLHNQPADFALGTLFAIGWGMAAWHQLFNGSVTDRTGLLTAICYTGAYAKTINVDTAPSSQDSFLLSPPDMDEATSAMLNLVGLPQAYGARGTSGLERIQQFVTGYNGGLSACS
jgi:predicted metalloprotease